MVLRLKDAVLLAVETGEPVHLPGTVVCPAIQKWSWADGHQRLRQLASHADVEVRLRDAKAALVPLAAFSSLWPSCPAISEGHAHAMLPSANTQSLQVMISPSSSFKGDFQNRRLQAMRLDTLLNHWQDSGNELEHQDKAISQLSNTSKHHQHMFLAQAPLTGALEPLLRDLVPPPAIFNLRVSSTNIWMNHSAVATSAHYDPHHNLLCVLCGYKRITLWPPSSTPNLQPHAFCGESSNHSTLSMHERNAFTRATDAAAVQGRYFQIDLHPGDALFLPAGWWHEVESTSETIAVNYWCGLGAADARHMAPFHLRHALHACMHTECERTLARMRSVSRAYVQQHTCRHMGRKSLIATAAELLHRHVYVCIEKEKRSAGRENIVGVRGLACDAVAIASLGQRKVLWLLEQWHRVAPETLASWLLQCMSPAAAEALTDTLERTPEDDVHANDSCSDLCCDFWANEHAMHDRSVSHDGASERLRDKVGMLCVGGENRCCAGVFSAQQDAAVAASRNDVCGTAEGAFTTLNCDRKSCDWDMEKGTTGDHEMCKGEITLGEFAQQVAVVEQQQQEVAEVGSGQSGQRKGHVERGPGMEVLEKVFGLVDTAALTHRLEDQKAQWREDCLMRVLKSHL